MTQLSLFPSIENDTSRSSLDDNSIAFSDPFLSEGMKYTGSKLKLLKPIHEMTKDLEISTVLDGFAGTTRVSRLYALRGCSVYVNDLAPWSATIASAHLASNAQKVSRYKEIIDHLNFLPPLEGWFTEHYGNKKDAETPIRPDGKKAVWQYHNTTKLDAIREEIDKLNLSEDEESVALTSLIYALDKVDSTLGHYAAYLKDWSPRSYNSLKLEVPTINPLKGKHSISSMDIFERLKTIGTQVDLAYFDPPYGSNNEKMPPSRVRYASYYHLWKTVILNDEPEVFGAANRREDSRDSVASTAFEDFRRSDKTGRFLALEAIENMVQSANCHYLLLSYSSGGRATFKELTDILGESGKLLQVAEIEYKRNVMAGMRTTNQWVELTPKPNIEYLFLLEKH